MNYLLGMDLGTTNMKGVLYNELGGMVAAASRTYETLHFDCSCAEQNPNDWWQAALGIFQEITAKVESGVTNQIKGICISSQTPTLLPVKADGSPIQNAMIWMDRRADQELEEILQRLGEEQYIAITGMLPDVSFLPAKLLWFKKNEPEKFAQMRWILQANSYVNYKLTGVISMDMDQASLTQCLDTNTGQWSEKMGEVIGVDFNYYLPRPLPNHQIIGAVTKEAAKLTGLAEGIPVVAGSSDAIAAMYASGLCRMGEATEVSGTSSLVFAGTKSLPRDYHTVGAHKCALDGIPYVYNAPISATGASIQWFLKNFGEYEYGIEKMQGKSVYEVLNEAAAHAKPGSKGVMFFPYMMGERAPLWNNHAKGMFIGLTMDTKREDIIRSIFEGTAYALKSVLEEFKRNGTEIDCLRIVGGGACSETWVKIKASILNLPILLLDKKTGDVPFGDALIAGKAVGLYSDLSSSIKELIQVEKIIQPNPEWVEFYEKTYPYFKKFYGCLDEDLRAYELMIKR